MARSISRARSSSKAASCDDPDEAVKLALQTAKTKFDETMEISVRLGVDPRQADQQVRGAVVPHGTGKKRSRPRVRQGQASRPRPPRRPARITSALRSWLRRSRAKNWFDFSTSSSRPRT